MTKSMLARDDEIRSFRACKRGIHRAASLVREGWVGEVNRRPDSDSCSADSYFCHHAGRTDVRQNPIVYHLLQGTGPGGLSGARGLY